MAVADDDAPTVPVLVGVRVGVTAALTDTVGTAVADDDAPTVPELVGVSVGVTTALADTVGMAVADDDAPTVAVLVGVSVGVTGALADRVAAADADADEPLVIDAVAVSDCDALADGEGRRTAMSCRICSSVRLTGDWEAVTKCIVAGSATPPNVVGTEKAGSPSIASQGPSSAHTAACAGAGGGNSAPTSFAMSMMACVSCGPVPAPAADAPALSSSQSSNCSYSVSSGAQLWHCAVMEDAATSVHKPPDTADHDGIMTLVITAAGTAERLATEAKALAALGRRMVIVTAVAFLAADGVAVWA